MIPAGSTIRNATIEEAQQPSKTYKLDLEKGRIVGMADGIDAIKQAVYCILQTDRFRYLVYSFDYGNELSSVIGLSPLFVESEIRRLLYEALTQDDRIDDLQVLDMQRNGDQLEVQFRVFTNIGSFDEVVAVSV